MAKRATITVNVNPLVAKRFRDVVDQFDDIKIGACVEAAMALFIRSTPEQRKSILQGLYTAEIEGSLETFLTAATADTPKRKKA